MERPLVSAIVLTYRTPQLAVRCVQALRAQSIADRLEILVVDNHSEDDTIGVVRTRLGSVPSVRIVESPRNGGYGNGNNRAARLAAGEYLLVINPDNELEPRALEQMIARMESDASIGMLAPRLVHPDGTVRDSCRRFPRAFDILLKRTWLRFLFPKRLEHYLQHDRSDTGIRETDWVAGACLFLRRSLYEELGGFDERFFLFFEDTDLCRRVWKAGKRVVYDPGITAFDRKERLSEGGVWSLLRSRVGRAHMASAVKYFWKWRVRG